LRGIWHGERKKIRWLFLRLLNFTPELVAKTHKESQLQHACIDVLIRDARGKHLKDLKVARQEEDAEMREQARLGLRAHFVEDATNV
jgi:hypothetical protein